jgi:hypothetical protein
VTLFVPSVTRDGEPVDQVYWREEALKAFGELFRGGTAYPPGRGVWRDDDAEGALLFEDVVIVFSIVPSDVLDDEAIIRDLSQFLQRLRLEANQGEIGLMIGEYYLGITDPPEQDR